MKFSRQDKKFFAARRRLAAKMGKQELWFVVDHWPLYCGVSNLARYIAILDILRSTLNVPGHVAEFGSWRGANLMFIAKVLRIFDPHGSKQTHCFESFEGLSTFSSEDNASIGLRGKYRGSLRDLTKFVKLYELEDDIVIHKGQIATTLPATLKKNPGLSFSFVYCDVDLFEPTRQILDLSHPRLSIGGVFVLDEWNYGNFPGESLAVRSFLERHGDAYSMEHVPRARQPSLVLRKKQTRT
jgi:hypothetical protein